MRRCWVNKAFDSRAAMNLNTHAELHTIKCRVGQRQTGLQSSSIQELVIRHAPCCDGGTFLACHVSQVISSIALWHVALLLKLPCAAHCNLCKTITATDMFDGMRPPFFTFVNSAMPLFIYLLTRLPFWYRISTNLSIFTLYRWSFRRVFFISIPLLLFDLCFSLYVDVLFEVFLIS